MKKFKPFQLVALLICLFVASFTASAENTYTYFLTLKPYQEETFAPASGNYARIEWYVSSTKDYDCNVIGEYAEVTNIVNDNTITVYFNARGLYLVTYLYFDSSENLVRTDVYDIVCQW
jgi:hypothetical protein